MSTQTEIPHWRQEFDRALAMLPDSVDIPPQLTPEGERLVAFRKTCPPEFICKIDRDRLPNQKAFDEVAQWHGNYPGPCATGATDTAKTRAAWSALGRLYVREHRPFAWFPVRRLVTEMARYEDEGISDEFFRAYSFYKVLFVDDLDKINFQFDSQRAQIFAFYDWVYRANRPCISTTNKGRTWWADKMGDAFARRLFDDAHFVVNFT